MSIEQAKLLNRLSAARREAEAMRRAVSAAAKRKKPTLVVKCYDGNQRLSKMILLTAPAVMRALEDGLDRFLRDSEH